MNNLGAALVHRRRRILALSFYGRGLTANPTDIIVRGNINRLVFGVINVAVASATALAILTMFSAGRHPTGPAAVVTNALTLAAAAALITIVVGAPIWYLRLPQSLKLAIRDRASWAETFRTDSLTRGELTLRLVMFPFMYVFATWVVSLFVMAIIQALPGGESRTGGNDRTVLWIGLTAVAGSYALMKILPILFRNRVPPPRTHPPRRVPVDWP